MQELEENFKKNGGKFESFRVGDVFTIATGSLVSAKKLISGNIPRLSVTSQNNGIIGFFDTENIPEARHYENFISVNFLGNVFYHPYKASCEMKVHILQLKEHQFTQETGLYVASVLRKAISGNYSYGEQLSSSDLKNSEIYIQLPVKNEIFDFNYMAEYVRELETERVRELETYLLVSGLNDYQLTDNERKILRGGVNCKFRTFNFDEIFAKAQTGNFDIQRSHVNGKGCLYINSGLENQGIVGMTDAPAKIFEPETITVDMFGLAWYRDFAYKMATHAHVFSLSTLNHLSSNCLLYIVSTMFYLKQKYNYNNMCNWSKMLQDSLLLPVLENGQIDTAYMDAYISALKKLVIRDVVAWKDKEINAYKSIVDN